MAAVKSLLHLFYLLLIVITVNTYKVAQRSIEGDSDEISEELPKVQHKQNRMDKVLLDAPCRDGYLRVRNRCRKVIWK